MIKHGSYVYGLESNHVSLKEDLETKIKHVQNMTRH